MESVLKAVQLLWINLIMDTFAALALATDPPTEKILDRPPQGKKAPLITTNMWKMIVGQAIFQLVVTLVFYFAGPEILGYDRGDSNKMLELDTIIFNMFVWMQIFNEFNNRRLDNKFNILEGVHRNYFFIAINILMVGLQVCIVYVGSRAFGIHPGGLDGPQWAISIIVALMCWPWAILVRLFPDAWFASISKVVGWPFLVAYRAMGRAWDATFGRMFKAMKPKKRDEEANAAEDQDEQEHHDDHEETRTAQQSPPVPQLHIETAGATDDEAEHRQTTSPGGAPIPSIIADDDTIAPEPSPVPSPVASSRPPVPQLHVPDMPSVHVTDEEQSPRS